MKTSYLILMFSLFIARHVIGQQTDDNNRALSNHPDSAIFTITSVMPEFGKNDKALQKYINKASNFKMSKERTPETKNVFVQVVVEKDGSLTIDKILRSYNEDMSNEAVRIIKTMPKWNPGEQNNGDKVRVLYIIPFWFL